MLECSLFCCSPRGACRHRLLLTRRGSKPERPLPASSLAYGRTCGLRRAMLGSAQCPCCGGELPGGRKVCSGKCRATLSRRRRKDAQRTRNEEIRALLDTALKKLKEGAHESSSIPHGSQWQSQFAPTPTVGSSGPPIHGAKVDMRVSANILPTDRAGPTVTPHVNHSTAQ